MKLIISPLPMDNAPIQQIKERLDIVEVVSGYLKLEKTGINLRARCPFHAEKGPSFFVSPSRQMFKCFGCSASGSVFDFVMRMEGLEFGDTLRLLAKKAGVELKSNINPEQASKRARLYEVCELATRFFEKYLAASQAGQLVYQYLLGRGLTQESIKKWRLGYAPDSWRALIDFLLSRGYKREEVITAGLAIQSEKSQTPYDRFRNRIMFPVFDLNSQAIGFGGRIFDKLASKTQGQAEGGAKYVNISNTPLYDKGRVLYGLNFAKLAMRQKDSCILTEGYMDVILCHQAGSENTVAASGTALTSYQLQIIKRYTNNLLSAFDMDPAGGIATTRGINLAQKEDFNVKVIVMPQGQDPADIISQAPEQWSRLTENAVDVMEFYFQLAQARFDKTTSQGKKDTAKLLLPLIKRVPNKIVQSHWLQKLANVVVTSESNLLEEMAKLPADTGDIYQEQPQGDVAPVVAKPIASKSRQEMLEERIMCLLCQDPQNISMIQQYSLDVFHPRLQDFFSIFLQEQFKAKEHVLDFLQKTENQNKIPAEIFEFLSFGFSQEPYNPNDKMAQAKKSLAEKARMEELGECLRHLRHLVKKGQAANLAQEIQLAEQQGDFAKLQELLQVFHQQACTK